MKPFREAEDYADDLQAAYNYYKDYSAKSASNFLKHYLADIALIASNPLIARTRRHGWRQIPIRRHPRYAIFYKELPDFWLLGGVASTLRDPDRILVDLLIREASEE